MKMKNFAIFVAGMLAGGTAVYFGLREVFEKRANEEIESVKNYYRTEEPAKDPEVKEPAKEEPVRDANKDITEYLKIARNNGYVNYSDRKDEEKSGDQDVYVIEPEEYGQGNDFEVIQLTYYAGDRVLADDGDMRINDISATVGDALNHMGEYEEDIVHVRNHQLKADFEIVLDKRRWADVAGESEM